MGFLDFLSRRRASGLIRLPAGCFTMDPQGRIVVSTLPQSFPTPLVKAIGQKVLSAFHHAREAQIPLTEIIVNYATFKVTAREMRGGAVVFLKPQSLEESSI